ncbi:MAG: carboxyltransferase domain-containing protein [Pseudomonadota bacterium]
MTVAQLLPLGPDGVLVRFADRLSDSANRAALAFRARVDRAHVPGVVETATSLTSVFVRFRPDEIGRDALEDRLNGMLDGVDWLDAPLPDGRTLWHIPAVFSGPAAPDLEAVSAEIGLGAAEAVRAVTRTTLRVLALGFAPGQPYLGFLDEVWNIARRTEVTPEVPRGAVVVAVRQVIPFANPSPTGWWQIGQTAFRCHDPEANPALPLRAGDDVRFHAVSSTEWQRLLSEPRGGAEAERLS